jgi:2-keto-4-pentenoate hydratase
MNNARIDQAAAALVAARRDRIGLDWLPGDVAPSNVTEAYAVQDRFRALWDDRVAGWKTGATATAVQQRFGLDAPFTGPVFARDVVMGRAAHPAANYVHCAVECEFAFRLGRAFAAGNVERSRSDVLDGVAALVPAIEIVSPRFSSLMFDAAPTAIADCAVNSGLVLGAPVSTFDAGALPDHPVRLIIDGVQVAEGTGAKVMGDPIAALVWTVNHLNARGVTLNVGDILSTGTTTGIVYVAPDAKAVADFGHLGRVELTFTGPPHRQAVTRLP